jgi:hypothetical protein
LRSIKSLHSRSPSTSPTKTNSAETSTTPDGIYQTFASEFKPLTDPDLDKLLKKLQKPDYQKFVYPVEHVFAGSGGGGKHFLENLDEAYIENPDLPFVQNNEFKQLMGIVYLKGKTKLKFSSIFPLQNKNDIHEKLLLLDLKNPYAKGKIYFRGHKKNSIIMEFDGYFIAIDLDNFKYEGLEDIVLANTIYPLFHLKAITEEDLWSTEKLIELVNYSILQEDGQWSENLTAQISSEDLNLFLQRAFVSMDEFKKYALACSAENILINMPYDFAVNRVNLDFETRAQNITKNMYKITLEIPKSIAYSFNPGSYNYCDILTSD